MFVVEMKEEVETASFAGQHVRFTIFQPFSGMSDIQILYRACLLFPSLRIKQK
jgi:hypothetical protein